MRTLTRFVVCSGVALAGCQDDASFASKQSKAYTNNDLIQCSRSLNALRMSAVHLSRPSTGKLGLDEDVWASYSDEKREQIAHDLACESLNHEPLGSERVEIIGYPSDRVLATLSSAGFKQSP